MDLLSMLLVLVAGPILLLWWSVHVARRWQGSWRLAPMLPGGIFAAGLLMALVRLRGELGIHSGWGIPLLISVLVAGIVAFVLHERHAAAIRVTSPTSAPDEPAA